MVETLKVAIDVVDAAAVPENLEKALHLNVAVVVAAEKILHQ